MTCTRVARGVSLQAGKAAVAAAMAELTSAAVHLGAVAITSPVLELVTGMYSPLWVSRHSPSTKHCNFLGVTTSPFRR
jgi:hypothetical protein